MAGLNSVEIDKSSWFKWPYAVAVGAPVAIGIGYWYLFRKSKSDPSSKINNDISDLKATNSTSRVSSSTNTSPGVEINSSVTQVESVKSPVKEETPLERAIALKGSGNTFFKSKKYEDAIRCYTEAIEICPENEKSHLATFYQNRAAAYEHMQNFEGSKKDCSAALELDPKYVKALQRRAKAYEQLGDLTSCLEDITAVCILEMFKNEQSLLTADRVLQQIGKNYAKEALKNRKTVLLSKHFVKAYFNSFSNDPVVKFKNEVNGHSTEENNITGLEKAKKCLLEGEYENVVEICNKELEKNDKLWEALLLRATMLFLVGEQKLSLADLNAIIDGDCPDVAIKVNALIKRASLYLQIETPEMSAADRINMPMKNEIFMPEKSMKDFAAAEELDPDNADVYHHRGQVLLLMDKMDLALEDLKKALKRNPASPVIKVQMNYAQYRLASNFRDLDTISKCIDAFKDVMKSHPDCIEAYSLFIQICSDQQNYEQADEYFVKAIKADPTNATVRVQRATLYLQWKADIDKAIELIEEAVKIDDRCEYGYETLGTIEVQRGNLTRAIELFDKALQFAKGERELAHIYSLQGAAKAQAVVAERLGLSTSFRPS